MSLGSLTFVIMIRALSLPLLFILICTCQSATEEKRADSDEGENAPLKAEQQKDKGIIRCFAYHRFGDDRYPSTNISLDRFEAHLNFLEENDYSVLTLGKAMDRMNSKEGLPGRTAVLTMDDGYKSVKTGALPLLEKYGFPATIFVCTEYVGGKNNLSWDELKELQKKGFEIGNHSHSHAHFLNEEGDERERRFQEDLEESEAQFKENMGMEPEVYAYPYGEYSSELEEILEEEGYDAGVAQNSGVIHSGSDRYSLPRFPMTSHYGKIEKFKEKARMHPLRVSKVSPKGPIVKGAKAPELMLELENDGLNPDAFQCFVDGSDACEMKIEKEGERIQLKAQSSKEITDRRTLYTITAPSKDGEQWHWYSHLWVRPDKGE